MGTVPPRILPPIASASLDEAPREYIDDGQGGILFVEGLEPIYQYGKRGPIAYHNRQTGDIWRVEQDEPQAEQYEDALVSYNNV